MQFNGRIHPMGEVVFHPAARRGDPEWRVMYIGAGDGGAGESRTAIRSESAAARHAGRQDPAHHSRSRPSTTNTSTLSENGRYRIPNDNPFVVEARRTQGNLGVRPSQSAPPELGAPIPQSAASSLDRCRRSGCARGKRSTSFARAQTTATRSAKAISCCSRTTSSRRCRRSTKSRCRSATR